MKYETPELTALTAAVDAIQGTAQTSNKKSHQLGDSTFGPRNESVPAYADWE